MKAQHPSILRVLGWRLSLVSLLFAALIVGLLQSKLQTAARGLFHQALVAEGRSVLTRLRVTDGKLSFPEPDIAEEIVNIMHYRVFDGTGKLLYASPNLLADVPGRTELPAALLTAASGYSGDVRFFALDPPFSKDRFIGVSLKATVGGRPAVVEVFMDLDQRGVLLDDLVQEFFLHVGWLIIPFVALLLLVNLLTIWMGLRPLTEVSRMASEIGPETTGRRLPEKGQPREILPLIRSVNRALERLDKGFQVQRQFTADAAHELRTPLAVLSAHLETLGEGTAVAALRREVAGMTRLVGQLLRIAQLDALATPPAEQVDLHAIAVDAASALAPLALKQGKSIAVSGVEHPLWVRGDIEALTQAIRNLIENALIHTPRGTTVELELGEDRTLRVSDAGPGVPPENRDKIFQRFWRADRREGGAGLGLAIVAKVAETHGGSVHVEESHFGGASFVLTLPAPEEAAESTAAEGHRDTPRRPGAKNGTKEKAA
ncbi:MAG TPA: HAMP domain-containing sensor histidine kinase [Alphaproteobacteria bacterium]|nr:HAMP domain-containing sensor histidine kinase [Alphaproteobacteria bacterium]